MGKTTGLNGESFQELREITQTILSDASCHTKWPHEYVDGFIKPYYVDGMLCAGGVAGISSGRVKNSV